MQPDCSPPNGLTVAQGVSSYEDRNAQLLAFWAGNDTDSAWHEPCAVRGVWRTFLSVASAVCLFLAGGGCGVAPSDRSVWIGEHGGLVAGAFQSRADAALSRLAPPIKGGKTVSVCVLGSDSIGAFGWPDGTLYVHRGLIEALSDEELSAALAHELGHLLNDGRIEGIASLRGCARSFEEETRADEVGVAVLKSSGIGPSAMIRMLTKVRNLLPDAPYCRAAIGRRIQRLEASER